jgi:hypothetical protein
MGFRQWAKFWNAASADRLRKVEAGRRIAAEVEI